MNKIYFIEKNIIIKQFIFWRITPIMYNPEDFQPMFVIYFKNTPVYEKLGFKKIYNTNTFKEKNIEKILIQENNEFYISHQVSIIPNIKNNTIEVKGDKYVEATPKQAKNIINLSVLERIKKIK